MTTLVLVLIILVLLGVNISLWKLGSVHDAENPKSVLDRPLMDPKERKAIRKRLRRWKEEGKLSTAEYETVSRLCDEEWDPSSNS